MRTRALSRLLVATPLTTKLNSNTHHRNAHHKTNIMRSLSRGRAEAIQQQQDSTTTHLSRSMARIRITISIHHLNTLSPSSSHNQPTLRTAEGQVNL
jgi:hypothetical protein